MVFLYGKEIPLSIRHVRVFTNFHHEAQETLPGAAFGRAAAIISGAGDAAFFPPAAETGIFRDASFKGDAAGAAGDETEAETGLFSPSAAATGASPQFL